MSIFEELESPRRDEGAVAIEDDHRQIAATVDVDAVVSVAGDSGDPTQLDALWQLSPAFDHVVRERP
jgi:hypothetical protein